MAAQHNGFQAWAVVRTQLPKGHAVEHPPHVEAGTADGGRHGSAVGEDTVADRDGADWHVVPRVWAKARAQEGAPSTTAAAAATAAATAATAAATAATAAALACGATAKRQHLDLTGADANDERNCGR